MSHPQADAERRAIADSAFIGPNVRWGRDVSVGDGAVVSGSCTIGDGCTIGAGAVLEGADSAGHGLRLEAGVVVMAGSVIAGSLTVGRSARVQAGAVVQHSVPAFAVVSGNPAQIVGYTLSDEAPFAAVGPTRPADTVDASPTRVKGVTLHRFTKILDLRGNLTVGEFGRNVPFEPKRYFLVFGVPNAEIRGEHAHRVCKQFLICTSGRCHVVADDGENREEFVLDDPSVGLYLPELTWGIQYKYSADAVLLVFASHFYDSAEYIRDYNEFSQLTAQNH
jgi:UDP-2-acetamido-3-amino-2,3-dideoxy-glucuronate N-acetyltransferase